MKTTSLSLSKGNPIVMDHLNKDYYSIREVSKILNRSITAIYNNIYSKASKHKINAEKINGQVSISKEELAIYKQFLHERDGIVEIDCEYAIKKSLLKQNKIFCLLKLDIFF